MKPHGSVAWVPCFEYSWSRAPNPDNRYIDAVSVCFRTGKTNQTSDRSLKYEVVRHRSAPGKILFLDMMGQFILFARWSRPEDYFFSRKTAPLVAYNRYNLGLPRDRNLYEVRAAARTPARYRYNRQGVADLTKAVAVRFDLDPLTSARTTAASAACLPCRPS